MDILNDIVHFLQEPVFDLPMGVEDFFVMVGVLMGEDDRIERGDALAPERFRDGIVGSRVHEQAV